MTKGITPIDRRPPLNDRQKQLLLLVLIRHKETFLAVKDRLSPAHFNEYERGYAVLWKTVLDCYEKYEELPGLELLMTEVERQLELQAEELLEEELQDLELFIESIYLVPYETLQPKVALRLCKWFLQDRLVERARDVLREGRDIPTSVLEVFSEMTTAASDLETMQGTSIGLPFDDEWMPKPLPKTPTNVGFIDTFLNGGQVAKECYGLMGPIGSCKTTIGLQLSIEGAALEYAEWEKGGRTGQLGVWFYVQYEEPIEPDILLRAISYSGGINRDSIETFDWDKLSTSAIPSTLKEYELKRTATQRKTNQPVFGERERFVAARERLRRNWRPIDMSGSDPRNPSQGHGLVPELARLLKNYLQEHPHEKAAGVVIDHVSAACERHIVHHNKDHSEIRHLIGKFPMHAKREIAGHLYCPVWCLHQVSGEANSKSAGTVLHFTDSAESKAFAEFLTACFTIGNKDRENHCILALRKGRRLPPKDPIIVEIDGGMNRVLDTEGAHVLQRNKIVSRADAHKIAPDVIKRSGPVQTTLGRVGY